MAIHITENNIDAFLNSMETAIVLDQAVDLAKIAQNAGIKSEARIFDTNRAYRGVPRYSHTFIAQQADRLDPREIREALERDAKEPETHKAWRRVLGVHSQIRDALENLWFVKQGEGRGHVRICRRYMRGYRSGRVEPGARNNALEQLAHLRRRKAEA